MIKYTFLFIRWRPFFSGTYLFLLLVKVVNDDTNEQVECEEGPKDDEDDKVEIHVQVHFILRLFSHLKQHNNIKDV